MTARVAPFDAASASPDQLRAHAEFVLARGGDTGLPGGVYDLLLRSPEAARRLAAVGAYCRFGTGLDHAVVEATILATSHALGFSYGTGSHEEIGRRAGLTEEQLEHLRAGHHSLLPGALRRAADLGRAAALGAVPERVYRQVAEAVGEAGAVDLALVVAYYSALCVVARSLDPELAGGLPDA